MVTRNACLFLFLIIFVFSCTNVTKEEKYDLQGNLEYLIYLNGKDTINYFKINKKGDFEYWIRDLGRLRNDTLKEYYPNGNLLFYMTLKGTDLVFLKSFYPNGLPKEEGSLFKGKKIDWWCTYKDNKLSKKQYYVQENGKLLMNQIKVFTENEQLDTLNSNFIDILIPDTLYLGRSTGTLLYRNRQSRNSEERIIIGYDLAPDYSNIYEVKKDTFYNVNKDGFFGVDFSNLGRQSIRGLIKESTLDVVSDTELNIETVISYFNKDFFVIQRPDSIPKDKVMHYHIKK